MKIRTSSLIFSSILLSLILTNNSAAQGPAQTEELIFRNTPCTNPTVPLALCLKNCGGTHPIEVGGWHDTNDIDDIAFDEGCTGSLVNRGTKTGWTKLCAQRTEVPPVVFCVESCGGDYPVQLGGWRDTNDIDDLAFEKNCKDALVSGEFNPSGLRNRGTDAVNTYFCGRPGSDQNFRTCATKSNPSCMNDYRITIGGWRDTNDISTYGSGSCSEPQRYWDADETRYSFICYKP